MERKQYLFDGRRNFGTNTIAGEESGSDRSSCGRKSPKREGRGRGKVRRKGEDLTRLASKGAFEELRSHD